MTEVRSAMPFVEPLRRSVTLDCAVEQAFRAFTDDIASWWPLATYSVGRDRARSCRFEPGIGGRLVEVDADGVEATWAEVAAWHPPYQLLLRWHPGLPESRAQEVEVSFRPEGARTRVELEHRDWQQTDDGRRRREEYARRWQGLFEERFGAWIRANEAASRPAQERRS